MKKLSRTLLSFFCALSMLAVFSAPNACAQRSEMGQRESVSPEIFTPLEPKDPLTRARAHTELAALYFQDGELIIALEELTLAIAFNPEYATAYSMRALALFYLKEFPSAAKDFQKSIELDPRDPDISNNYGWYLCQTGKEKDALSYFKNAFDNVLYKTPEVAYLNAGMCLAKQGELDSAEEFVNRSLVLAPNNPRAFFQLAIISYKRENFDAARDYLNRVQRQVNETEADVLWLALRVERRLGNDMGEASLAAQLKRRFPDSPEYRDFLKGNFE
ncbi:MAG: type IV pilus biogenesis/stability protein PilW [Candidatus Accumulibacter sp.]|jgi:type IV pilus assembly protein PilF|nr:type IV pilus biogenesis/stability protein PilW [Accumulibacter sp.]